MKIYRVKGCVQNLPIDGLFIAPTLMMAHKRAEWLYEKAVLTSVELVGSGTLAAGLKIVKDSSQPRPGPAK